MIEQIMSILIKRLKAIKIQTERSTYFCVIKSINLMGLPYDVIDFGRELCFAKVQAILDQHKNMQTPGDKREHGNKDEKISNLADSFLLRQIMSIYS
jgi:hypothetical protein